MRVNMSDTAIGYKMLSHTLAVLSQKQATGKLLLEQGEQQWQLYFFRGSLVYATGGAHRARRWYRAIGQHCRNFQVDLRDLDAAELWEYQLIERGVAASEMSLEQAKAIVHSSISEVFCETGEHGFQDAFIDGSGGVIVEENSHVTMLNLRPFFGITSIIKQSNNVYFLLSFLKVNSSLVR